MKLPCDQCEEEFEAEEWMLAAYSELLCPACLEEELKQEEHEKEGLEEAN